MHVPISKSQLLQLNNDSNTEEQPLVVMTPLGNAILEIQGDLELPSSHSEDESVRFGLLDIQENKEDPIMSKVTLFVGKKQRLLGKVVSLETPLGLLHFHAESNQRKVKLEDIIRYKILFQDRPLPIM